MLAGSMLSNNIFQLNNEEAENERTHKQITMYNQSKNQSYASKSSTLIDSRMTNIRLNKLKNHVVIYDKTVFPSSNNINSYASAFAARNQLNSVNNNLFNRANSMYW